MLNCIIGQEFETNTLSRQNIHDTVFRCFIRQTTRRWLFRFKVETSELSFKRITGKQEMLILRQIIKITTNTLMGLIFANFANFGQIREIKSSRKVSGSPIRGNKYPRKTENNRFANTLIPIFFAHLLFSRH